MSISITQVVHKKAPNEQIVLSFPAPFNWFVINKLKRGEPCGCSKLANGSETTALLFALYQSICNELIGDAKKQAASKATAVRCNGQHGEFIIAIACDKSISSIRKCLTLSAKCISKLDKLFPAYAYNMELLGGPKNRGEFALAANAVLSKLPAKIPVLVVGKAPTFKKEQLEDMTAKINKALVKPAKLDTKGVANLPSNEEPSTDTEYPTFKITNIVKMHVVYDMTPRSNIHDDALIIYDERAKYDAKKASEKCKQLFGKFDDETIRVMMTYHMASASTANATKLIAFAKSKMTAKDICSA